MPAFPKLNRLTVDSVDSFETQSNWKNSIGSWSNCTM